MLSATLGLGPEQNLALGLVPAPGAISEYYPQRRAIAPLGKMGNEDNSKQELQDGQPQIMDGQDDSHVASLSTPMVAEGAHAAPGTAEKNGIIPLSVTSGEASLLELVGRLASGGRCSESEAAALVYTTAAVLAQHSQRHTEEQLQHHIEETSQQESQENAQQDAAQHAPQRIQRNSQQGFGSPLFVPLRHAQAPGTASGLVSAGECHCAPASFVTY